MESKRLVIIGAVASGTKTAAKARREDPYAEITLITEEAEISYASCGTPYFISDKIKDSHSLIVREPDYFRKMLNTDVLYSEVKKLCVLNFISKYQRLSPSLLNFSIHSTYIQL